MASYYLSVHNFAVYGTRGRYHAIFVLVTVIHFAGQPSVLFQSKHNTLPSVLGAGSVLKPIQLRFDVLALPKLSDFAASFHLRHKCIPARPFQIDFPLSTHHEHIFLVIGDPVAQETSASDVSTAVFRTKLRGSLCNFFRHVIELQRRR